MEHANKIVPSSCRIDRRRPADIERGFTALENGEIEEAEAALERLSKIDRKQPEVVALADGGPREHVTSEDKRPINDAIFELQSAARILTSVMLYNPLKISSSSEPST